MSIVLSGLRAEQSLASYLRLQRNMSIGSKPPEPHPPAEPAMSISDLLPTDLEATWAGFVEEPLAGEMKSLSWRRPKMSRSPNHRRKPAIPGQPTWVWVTGEVSGQT